MATRNTIQEAQELKARFETRYPARKFRVVDQSEKMRVGRRVAIAEGYEILEDTGSAMVTANCTQFAVLEIKHCECGAEVLTAAIGEDDFCECDSCYQERRTRQAKTLEDGIRNSTQRAAQADAFDEFWK
jgi:hypothetical protein